MTNPKPQPHTEHGPLDPNETSAGHAKARSVTTSQAMAQLSHELKTPLTSLKESARLLREEMLGPLTPKQRHVIESMEADADHLLRLVRNVLVLSKSRLGQLELFRQPLALEKLIHETVARLSPLLGRRTVHLDAHNIPPVFGDRDRLLQVLTNLLSNAVRCTADDGQLAIRAAVHGAAAEMTLTDNGCGIPPERLATLFEPFQSGPPSCDEPGTGLGLVICKELLERHGGTIHISSTVGQGTTVTCAVPLFTPETAVELFLREILEEGAPSDSTMTVCLIRLAGLADSRARHPACHERVEGIVRNHLRTVDRLCWVDAETVLVVAATDAEGAQQIMGRLRKNQLALTQAAGGRPLELFYGLACSNQSHSHTADTLLREARANLTRMIANW